MTAPSQTQDDAQGLAFAPWEQAMQAANAAFECGDAPAARLLYERAMAMSLQLLDSRPWQCARLQAPARANLFDAALAAFVVSHHNAAHLSECNGAREHAGALYRLAHATVDDLNTSPELDERLRTIAARHSLRTLGELSRHLRACGVLVSGEGGHTTH